MYQKVDLLCENICDILVRDKAHLLKKSPGLYDGILGNSLFLYHFGLSNDKREFALDEADEFLGSVISKIQFVDNDSFTSGLFGIGWGINYLIDREYVDADKNTLKEVDRILLDYNVYNKNLGVGNGTLGYAMYLASRYEKIFLPSEDQNEMLRYYEKCETMIRFINQLESNINSMFSKWEISDPGDLNNFFLIDQKFLIEFIHSLTSSYYFLSKLDKINHYPQIVSNILQAIESKIEICMKWCLNSNNNLNSRTVMQINQLFEVTLMLSCLASDFPRLSFFQVGANVLEVTLPVFMSHVDFDEYNYNMIIQMLVRKFHDHNLMKFSEAAMLLAENQFDFLSKLKNNDGKALGLKNGLSGIGLSMLGFDDKELMQWDCCIGLS